MEFKFKYVNEEQLNKVIRKVQRERRLRQDAANLVPATSMGRHVNALKTEEYVATEDEEAGRGSGAQSLEGSVPKEYYTFSSDKSRPFSASVGLEAKEKRQERVNALIVRLRNVRRNIFYTLDALIVHNEVIKQKDCRFKDLSENLDESVGPRVRNCLYLIIKQEYPFIVNMRRLSHEAFPPDMITHLKALLDCHNIALRTLKTFIRGAPYILKEENGKEKLNGLLERMLVLSSSCKLFSLEHFDIIGSKDFLMDDVDKKCVSLLATDKTQVKSVPKCYGNKHLKGLEQLCVHCGAGIVPSDSVRNYEMHIPKKLFKKLADRVFLSKEITKDTVKKGKNHHKDSVILGKNSKDKVNASREDDKIDADDSNDPPKELEQQNPGAINLQSSGGISLRDTTVSESNCEIAKEMVSNAVDDAEGLKAKEESATLELLNGLQNNLREVTEEYADVYPMKYHGAHSYNGEIQNEHDASLSLNKEKLKVMVSPAGEAGRSIDITKISDTAGRISDRVVGECLHRVGGEVDIFIEEFVKRMFSLEFT